MIARSRRLRILLITGIFPPDVGGPASYIPLLARELCRGGHAVTVLTLADSEDTAPSQYPFAVLKIRRRQFRLLRLLRTVVQIIRLSLKADLLLVNGLALEATLANLVIRRPLIMKVVGDLAWERARNAGTTDDTFEEFQINKHDIATEAIKTLRAWWTRRATRVIVPSRYLAHWTTRWNLSPSKVDVIYNSPDLPLEVASASPPITVDLKIITVCRLVPWKHVDRLIDSVALFPSAGLIIVGDGPERPALERLVSRLNIQNRVYFAGQRNKADTTAFMKCSDIFVLNSSYEGLPHVILEAMTLGLPIVATSAGGTPEIIRHGETGILIPPLADASLHTSLAQLISSSAQRHQLGMAASMESSRYSKEVMLDNTIQVIYRCIRREAGEGSMDRKTA